MTRIELDEYLDQNIEDHVKTELQEFFGEEPSAEIIDEVIGTLRDILRNEVYEPAEALDRVITEMFVDEETKR